MIYEFVIVLHESLFVFNLCLLLFCRYGPQWLGEFVALLSWADKGTRLGAN